MDVDLLTVGVDLVPDVKSKQVPSAQERDSSTALQYLFHVTLNSREQTWMMILNTHGSTGSAANHRQPPGRHSM